MENINEVYEFYNNGAEIGRLIMDWVWLNSTDQWMGFNAERQDIKMPCLSIC